MRGKERERERDQVRRSSQSSPKPGSPLKISLQPMRNWQIGLILAILESTIALSEGTKADAEFRL